MSILVCGGAGYIGSHTVYKLIEQGKDVVIIDNLQSGHMGAVHPKAKFYKGDIRDAAILDKIFTENKIQSIVHFAANSLVGESMIKPLLYFNNNVYGMQILLESMVKHDIKNIVFSSTAAVYGEPKKIPILEDDETNPTNTYGETKLTMEKMMRHQLHRSNKVLLTNQQKQGQPLENGQRLILPSLHLIAYPLEHVL